MTVLACLTSKIFHFSFFCKWDGPISAITSPSHRKLSSKDMCSAEIKPREALSIILIDVLEQNNPRCPSCEKMYFQYLWEQILKLLFLDDKLIFCVKE